MLLTVIEFAPAKVNLALHVLGRRADGYHELDSVVAFADVGDVLEIALSPSLKLSVDGPFAEHVPSNDNNLILKAYAALAQVAKLPPVHFKLTKNLPVASGIGGGSADAAAALRGLIRLTGLTIEPERLQPIALSLGADVPVCLLGQTCRMQGVGEVITALEQSPAAAILLANPLVACNTADVFRGMGLKAGETFGATLDHDQPTNWRNDMTAAACHVLPNINEVLNALATLPHAKASRMSGSGATCFALFDNMIAAQNAEALLLQRYSAWWIKAARLL
jgi:4-diphosphocytidyl-2-C-methyl-D-erythritol kinase